MFSESLQRVEFDELIQQVGPFGVSTTLLVFHRPDVGLFEVLEEGLNV